MASLCAGKRGSRQENRGQSLSLAALEESPYASIHPEQKQGLASVLQISILSWVPVSAGSPLPMWVLPRDPLSLLGSQSQPHF